MFQITGAFAEFERSMIKTRVNAGIARAKVKGKYCGEVDPNRGTSGTGFLVGSVAAPTSSNL
jgi:DNA invertase Pin-like site-specific DNA recombinase